MERNEMSDHLIAESYQRKNKAEYNDDERSLRENTVKRECEEPADREKVGKGEEEIKDEIRGCRPSGGELRE